MILNIHIQFKIFYYNSKHRIYNLDYLSIKERKKALCMRFLAKVVAINSIKKIGVDSKNNYKDAKPAYFRLPNS